MRTGYKSTLRKSSTYSGKSEIRSFLALSQSNSLQTSRSSDSRSAITLVKSSVGERTKNLPRAAVVHQFRRYRRDGTRSIYMFPATLFLKPVRCLLCFEVMRIFPSYRVLESQEDGIPLKMRLLEE